MKQTPNCLQAKKFVGQSDLCRSRRECCRRIIKVVCCATSAFQTSSPQSFPIASLRIIKCLAWWKEVSVVPYTALELSWATVLRCYPEVFSKGNAMVILTSSRKRQHVLVEASGTTVVAICRRGAESINTFWFSKISAFFAEIYCFLRKTRLLSNLAQTPCTIRP